MIKKRSSRQLLAFSSFFLQSYFAIGSDLTSSIKGGSYLMWLLIIAPIAIISTWVFLKKRNYKPSIEIPLWSFNPNEPKQASEENMDSVINLRKLKRGKLLLSQVNKQNYLNFIENTSIEVNLVQDDIVSLVKAVFGSFQSVANVMGIKFELHTEVKQIKMDFDPDLMVVLFGNIFSHALKQSQIGSVTIFSVDYIDRHFIFNVSEQENQKASFKIDLEQSDILDTETTEVGFKITQRIIEILNGSIDVNSEEYNLLDFQLAIPVSKKSEIINVNERVKTDEYWMYYIDLINKQNEGVDVLENKKYPNVLVIDSQTDTATFVAFCMGDVISIQFASGGAKAKKYILNEVPDLIICNTVLPDYDGFVLCEEIKKHKSSTHVPLIMVSLDNEYDNRLRGLALGADAYLQKPINQKELMIRVEQLLSRNINHSKSEINIEEEELIIDKTEELLDNPILENDFIIKAKEVIEHNLLDPQFGLDLLSEKLKISQSQLRRKIFNLTGLTPVRFIRQYRISKAVEMLKKQDLNISQIAYETGFSDPKYFSRVFTKEIGLSPSEFRQKLRKKMMLL